MSIAPKLAQFAAWRPVESAAAEIRQECAATERLVGELLTEIDQLRIAVEHQADELEASRQHLAERERQLADQRQETGRLTHHLEQQEARLAETTAELRSLREELAREREVARQQPVVSSGTIEGDTIAPLMSELAELRQQLGRTQAELTTTIQQATSVPPQIQQPIVAASTIDPQSLAPLLSELFGLRQQLGQTQSDLAAAIQQAASPPPAIQPASTFDVQSLSPLMSELAELRQQLGQTQSDLTAAIQQAVILSPPDSGGQSLTAEMTEHIVALERQRAELESELELVRTRATELQQTVNDQRRELTDQHDELTSELKLLRELIEHQAELLSIRGSEPVPAAHPPAVVPALPVPQARPAAPPTPAEPAAEANPVVNSVMAQFARLQKDVAQRRQQKKK